MAPAINRISIIYDCIASFFIKPSYQLSYNIQIKLLDKLQKWTCSNEWSTCIYKSTQQNITGLEIMTTLSWISANDYSPKQITTSVCILFHTYAKIKLSVVIHSQRVTTFYAMRFSYQKLSFYKLNLSQRSVDNSFQFAQWLWRRIVLAINCVGMQLLSL